MDDPEFKILGEDDDQEPSHEGSRLYRLINGIPDGFSTIQRKETSGPNASIQELVGNLDESSLHDFKDFKLDVTISENLSVIDPSSPIKVFKAVTIASILESNIKPIVEIQYPLEESKSAEQPAIQDALIQDNEIDISSPMLAKDPELVKAMEDQL